MGNYDSLELQGSAREEAIGRIHKQMREWGLAMPDTTPLLLHFGLDRFAEFGEAEFWIANEEQHGYCGKLLFLFGGQTCPEHYHIRKHETFFVVRGTIEMRIGGAPRALGIGDVLPVPPGAAHSFTGVGNALVLEVSQPSVLNDNFFSNACIGKNGLV